MRITSIIENTSRRALPVEHGLSLYIETSEGHRVLFDMGQTALFAANARTLCLDISAVDVAVISHGHYDHGGGLKTFLLENTRANVFVHRDAFLPHYSLRDSALRYIGLDTDFQNDARLVLCGRLTRIGNGMTLFADVHGNCCYPIGNNRLFGPSETCLDTFSHEQSLIIEEADKVVLFAGCAHCGIINILRKAEELMGKTPTHVIAGMHLSRRSSKQVPYGVCASDDDAFISTLARELQHYDHTLFYTMHCTGEEQFSKLKSLMGPQIEYLSCGDELTI